MMMTASAGKRQVQTRRDCSRSALLICITSQKQKFCPTVARIWAVAYPADQGMWMIGSSAAKWHGMHPENSSPLLKPPSAGPAKPRQSIGARAKLQRSLVNTKKGANLAPSKSTTARCTGFASGSVCY